MKTALGNYTDNSAAVRLVADYHNRMRKNSKLTRSERDWHNALKVDAMAVAHDLEKAGL